MNEETKSTWKMTGEDNISLQDSIYQDIEDSLQKVFTKHLEDKNYDDFTWADEDIIATAISEIVNVIIDINSRKD